MALYTFYTFLQYFTLLYITKTTTNFTINSLIKWHDFCNVFYNYYYFCIYYSSRFSPGFNKTKFYALI